MADIEAFVIQTESGLEMFSPAAVQPDESGKPANLVSGTEYAALNGEQTTEFAKGEGTVRLEDTERYVGAFALIFTNPPSEVYSRTARRE